MARTGKEVGAVFSIAGDKAALVPISAGGTSASGQAIKTINCTVGDNVIRWSLSPAYGASMLKSTSGATYDPQKASWNALDSAIPQVEGSGAAATVKNWFKSPDADQAKQVAESNARSVQLTKQGGFVTIVGEPYAQVGGLAIVQGCRRDIDGLYKITSCTQTLVPRFNNRLRDRAGVAR